jgi:hypothetical protein
MFTMNDLDIILCNRLMKHKDENKFIYLYEAYERLNNHIWAKRESNQEKVKEMKSITARYFVTCLSCPDTFDLINNGMSIIDKDDDQSSLGQMDIMQAMMMQQMGGGNKESLASGATFSIDKMQQDLWNAVSRCAFTNDRPFMTFIMQELNEDPDSRSQFFSSVFDLMHLSLKNIKSETFYLAEKNLEMLRAFLEFEGAAESFVDSQHFFNSTMNGMQIQKHSYLGRYLSFSMILDETNSWRSSEMNIHFHKLRPEQHLKHMDGLSAKLFSFHTTISEVIKKLMKNPKSKDKVLLWLRKAVSLNMDK